MRGWVVLASLLLSGGQAAAYCSGPSLSETAPDAPGSYNKPDVPHCLSELRWSGKHSCESWEIDSYRRDVEDYVQKLQAYVDEANAFADSVSTFTQEAGNYARCEAEEVLTQHE